MESLNNSIKNYTKYWYIQVIVGIILLIFGGTLFNHPEATFITVTIFFVTAFLFTGLLEIMFAVINRNKINGWGWTLINGIISAGIGIYLSINVNMALEVFPLLISFAILFRASFAFFLSLNLKKMKASNWLPILLLSIVGIIFGIVTLSRPAVIEVYVVVLTAIAFITLGFMSIFYGLSLRSIKKNI